MALKTLAQLKAKFITGYKPTQADFADVFDSTGYLGAEGVQMIYPHLMSKRGSIQLFPITAGKPDGNFAALDLSAEYDYGPVIAHAFYEARKAGPKGAIVVFAGDMVTRRSFVCPPVNGAIMSMTLAASQLLYDGAVGTEFFLSGAKATTITRIPCTTAPSGGNTVVTLAASGHSEKTSTAAGLAGGWINLDYTNFAGEAITVDTWGQWVMQFPALGLTDGTSYFRAAIVSHDIAARTVTLAGNVGFTPTHLHAPGLTSGGTAYDVASCINSMHGLDFLSDMDFQCRNRGTVTQDVQRGVKGLADPRARWNNVRFRQSYATYINHDSDAIVEDLSIVQSFGATTLTSVDSAWQNIQWSATSGVGLTLAGDMSQSTWGGKNKGYYLSRQAVSQAEARSVWLAQNLSGVNMSGSFILEDTAGDCFYIDNNVVNVNFDGGIVEFNNVGSIGQGAPSTSDFPAYDAIGFRLKLNSHGKGVRFKGSVRSNPSNRDGFHMRHMLYAERCTTVDTTQGLGTMPYLHEDWRLEFTFDRNNFQQGRLRDFIDGRKPLWSAVKADYVTSDVVQLVNTADAPRYQPKVNNPTVAISPDVNTAQWKRVGGDRNAWISGFAEELLDPTNGSYRFFEFNNIQIILDGERDPSYHQRIISGRPAFTVDPQHDLVQASSGAASESRFDVFRGLEDKEQIWRGLDASAAKPFILQPGYRNDGVNVVGRTPTVPFIAGATWTVRRVNGEFRTVHKGGKVWPVAHEQYEELGVITALTVDLADYGHTLILGSTAACTVTMPTIANMPDGYWVRLVLTGTGSVSAISGVTGVNTLATNGTLTIRKTAAGYKGFAA